MKKIQKILIGISLSMWVCMGAFLFTIYPQAPIPKAFWVQGGQDAYGVFVTNIKVVHCLNEITQPIAIPQYTMTKIDHIIRRDSPETSRITLLDDYKQIYGEPETSARIWSLVTYSSTLD